MCDMTGSWVPLFFCYSALMFPFVLGWIWNWIPMSDIAKVAGLEISLEILRGLNETSVSRPTCYPT